MAAQFQPSLVKYVKDSCFVVEGKIGAERFFIIQEGKVRVSREADSIMESQEVGAAAGPGDIIGAVSVMSGFSFIETAVALTDVTVVAVEKQQYQELIRSNTRIAMKIIQQFSQRLRSLDEMLSRRALSSSGAGDPSHLLQVAAFYEGQKRFNQAFYAYQMYMVLCPQMDNIAEVKQKMMKIAPNVKQLKPTYPPDKMDRSYPPGCLLFAEGEIGNELYIIQQGSIKISKIVNNQEVVLAVLKKGDIFGEMALLEDKPRAATAEALEDCVVLAVNRANFESLIASRPELVARLTTLMAERIWLMYKQLANTLIENPLGRIYDAILIQLEKERIPLDTNQNHQFDFGFKELAGMAGISPEESASLLKRVILTKRITLINDKLYINDTSDVLRQTEYYRRAERTKSRGGVSL